MTQVVKSHLVRIPPLTDVTQMLGAYRGLLLALGIANNLIYPVQGQFTHPIPEENQRMTADFMNTMLTLKQIKIDHPDVFLSDCRVHGTSVWFTFTYEETTHYAPPPA